MVQEEARVSIVEVPVNVVDKTGKPVEGLAAADFEIYDDGIKQEVTGFEVLDQRRPMPPVAPGEPVVQPAARRNFLLLFDLTFGTAKGIVLARRAARDFVVTRMKDHDLVAVATYTNEQGMRLLLSFTGDRTQLAMAIDTLGLPGLADRSPDPLAFVMRPPSGSSATGFAYFRGNTNAAQGSGLDVALEEQLENMEIIRGKNQRSIYRDKVQRQLRSLADLARVLDAVPGRKHVLFLSEGFDSVEIAGSTIQGGGAREAEWVIRGQSWKVDNDTRFGNAGTQSLMTEALSHFNRSDCVVHTIDIGGLRAGADIEGVEHRLSGQETLNALADATGGEFLRNANDLGESFDRLLDRTGLVYLLVFQPVRVPETGKYHTLDVRVKNRSYRISHRTGYWEKKSYRDLSPVEKRLAASSALSAGLPRTEVPAWVLAAPFPAEDGFSSVPVIIEIPGDKLLINHTGPRMTVDVYAYANDREGTTKDYLFHTIGVDLAKAEAPLRKTGLKFYGEMRLANGEYTLRVLVRNNETGRMGVSFVRLDVPRNGSPDPFLLPPLFLDEGEPWILVKGRPREGQTTGDYPFAIAGQSFIPSAMADVPSGQPSRVCLIAYNFPAEGDLEVDGKVLDLEGKSKGKVDLLLMQTTEAEKTGARKLLLQFRPSGLQPGRYALAVSLADKSGNRGESSIPFDVQ
jgi:VWFA-related protein